MTGEETTSEDTTGGVASSLRRRLPLLAVLAASVALGVRMLLLVRHYSVNILVLDEWDYYEPLFRGMSLWRYFIWQVGPIRQGIGFLIYKYVSELSSWDSRAVGLASYAVVFAALLCALWLKKRLSGRLTYADMAIPTLFLTPVLTGAYTMIPNPAHGPFPLLLSVLYCLAWTCRGRLKYALVLLFNFLLIFTGFGLFMGLITPVLLALECYRAARRDEAARRVEGRRELLYTSLALVLSLASLAVFFAVGYEFNPAVACFRFPDPQPSYYFWYTSLMFACFWRFAGQGFLPYVVGSFLALLLAGLCAHHAYLLLRDRATQRSASLIITSLTGFSLLFAVNAAVGRVCTGLHTAQAPRYMPYLVPAFLALYFHLRLSAKNAAPLQRAALYGFLLMAVLTMRPLTEAGAVVLETFRRGKAEWKQCYLETENISECNARTHFEVYPARGAAPPEVFEERLSYLKRRRLNLYAGE
ncbi:MAG: hypothetical protein QOC61_326 [Acidobacteriota bacterium]|jgi:hypothetical protein|nr:hypothetical protein [Acidobacteriota bacterium]MDT5261322.1 hypothetical protein [Acidobacteriota bacterium]